MSEDPSLSVVEEDDAVVHSMTSLTIQEPLKAMSRGLFAGPTDEDVDKLMEDTTKLIDRAQECVASSSANNRRTAELLRQSEVFCRACCDRRVERTIAAREAARQIQNLENKPR